MGNEYSGSSHVGSMTEQRTRLCSVQHFASRFERGNSSYNVFKFFLFGDV